MTMGGTPELFWEEGDSLAGTTEALAPERRVVADADGVDTWLEEKVGDSLRTVGLYDGTTLELLFVRPDVVTTYDEGDFEDIAREMGFASALTDKHKERVYEVGDLDHVVRGFEEATMVRIPIDEHRGVFFSFDASEEVELPTLVEELQSAVDPEFR
ncbi:hypothetical protein SAMN04487949_2490 [Halogranum gelatinilyticum]|uniref:Uncharacterized protein n=1 Tax=Halogranum gelatinilyticum TaxID=660521 RepID=A0A1G9VSI9_9EURY|nr:hypothetical protein [Halogranum gelatinilyticum]SDM75110.1 hypothetical protein SAMN04487949_2490 [Halogranum gelatinilyticum]